MILIWVALSFSSYSATLYDFNLTPSSCCGLIVIGRSGDVHLDLYFRNFVGDIDVYATKQLPDESVSSTSEFGS